MGDKELKVMDDASMDKMIAEVEDMNKLCKKLMETKHFSKMGQEGVFAVMQKAKALNMDPIDALNGALYFVQGRVEMGAQTMNRLIRTAGHSIRKDDKSSNSICILHGKRRDNGDTWTESFSIDEAKAAGLIKRDGAWSKYPRDMLFARALSRLARQLFSDTICGCYVEGELSMAPGINEPVEADMEPIAMISPEQAIELWQGCQDIPEVEGKLTNFMKKQNIELLSELPFEWYDRLVRSIAKHLEEYMVTHTADAMEEVAEKVEVKTLSKEIRTLAKVEKEGDPEWFLDD